MEWCRIKNLPYNTVYMRLRNGWSITRALETPNKTIKFPEHTERHGHCSGGKSTEYETYTKIKQRCENPNNSRYKDYGGRGIELKLTFTEFLEEIGFCPGPGYSAERINNDKSYEKGNLRWATPTEQANNRRSNKLLTYQGITHTMAEWARIKQISYKALHWRLINGWSLEKALETKEKVKKYVTYKREKVTIDKLEKITGVHRSTIRERLSRGLTVEEAVQKGPIPRRNDIHVYKGIEKTERELAKIAGLSLLTFRQRIKSGWTVEEAVEIPKQKSKHWRYT